MVCDHFLFTLMKKKYHQIFYAVFFLFAFLLLDLDFSTVFWNLKLQSKLDLNLEHPVWHSSWFIADKSGFLSKLSDSLDSRATDDAILIMINLFITHVDQFLLVLS